MHLGAQTGVQTDKQVNWYVFLLSHPPRKHQTGPSKRHTVTNTCETPEKGYLKVFYRSTLVVN